MSQILLASILGVGIGLVLGLTGAGGSLLAVPLLVFFMGLSMQQAAPIALVAVGFSAAVSASIGLREGIVRYRAATLIGGLGLLLAPLGVYWSHHLPSGWAMCGFAGVMVYSARRMFQQAMLKRQIESQAVARLDGSSVVAEMSDLTVNCPCQVAVPHRHLKWTFQCARVLAATGAFSGLLTGLLGVGGGFVIVPALNHFTNLPQRSIVATSLAVIALVSAGSVAAAALAGAIQWQMALPFVTGAVAGILLGRRLASRFSGPVLQALFALLSFLVALVMLWRGVTQLSA